MVSNPLEDSTRAKTDRLLSSYLRRLPILPKVASSLLYVPASDRAVTDRAEALARLDPMLAFRLCAMAQSRFGTKDHENLSISSMLARAGSRNLTSDLSHLRQKQAYVPHHAHERELWLHSIQVALTARYFANLAPNLGVNGEEAYFCGLMHDLGRFIMMVAAPEDFGKLESRDWETGDDLVMAERAMLGYDHSQLGGMACVKWRLPKTLSLVMRFHHTPELPSWIERRTQALILAVKLGDAASMMMCKHPEVLQQSRAVRQAFLAEQGVAPLLSAMHLAEDQLVRAVSELYRKSTEMTREILGDHPLDNHVVA